MAKKKAAETESDSDSTVTLDPPSMPLLPGRTATFAARQAEGLAMVTITTDKDTWTGQASNSAGGARISKIIETGHTEITVAFSEDGKEYASGTFTVE